MFKRINQFFADDVPYIKTVLGVLVSNKKEEAADVKLLRHLLGSIHFEESPLSDLKEGERRGFAASIAIVYSKLHRIAKQLLEDQKEFSLTHDVDLMFAKGTINGIYLMLEEYERWRGEHIENTAPKEVFDKYATLPELLERYSRPVGLPSDTQGEKVD